eukprot:gene32691-43690_t
MKSSSSSAQVISDPLKQKQQIDLLKELHRPLEEHWNHCKPSTKGDKLDPIGSDKMFKHHIARLQDIYINRKFTIAKPFQVVTVSPMTHLYGPRGNRSRSSSPIGHSNSRFNLKDSSSGENRTSAEFSQQSQSQPQQSLQQTQQQLYDLNQRNKCVDPSVSQEQLLMLGMYRLTPEQEAVYQQFVSLLSSFETIDMVAPITAMLAILNFEWQPS